MTRQPLPLIYQEEEDEEEEEESIKTSAILRRRGGSPLFAPLGRTRPGAHNRVNDARPYRIRFTTSNYPPPHLLLRRRRCLYNIKSSRGSLDVALSVRPSVGVQTI